MSITENRVTNDIGLVEIQQTAALLAVFSDLDATDNDSWIDITRAVKMLAPGSPADRAMAQEYNASQKRAMVQRSNIIPNHTPQITLYDTNGVATDYGATNPFDLKALFIAARDNDIEVPLRYSVQNVAGDDIHTYDEMYVLGVEEQGLEPGKTESMTVVIKTVAEDRTTAAVV